MALMVVMLWLLSVLVERERETEWMKKDKREQEAKETERSIDKKLYLCRQLIVCPYIYSTKLVSIRNMTAFHRANTV